mmetsp:Transcript_4666/g.16722  ORF Transcript_4666/g.16722 Transcript_4666/m.16722 type:complete len:85 (+) Transcript_4666:34-288(+)
MLSMLADTAAATSQGEQAETATGELSEQFQQALTLKPGADLAHLQGGSSSAGSQQAPKMPRNTKYFAMNEWQLHITQISAVLTI